MYVNEGDIAKYIQEHDDLYTCTIEGKKHVLLAKDDQSLSLKDRYGYFMSFESNKATFVNERGGVAVEGEATFPPELIKAIKDEALDKAIRHNLERLLPAAKAMLQHYNAPYPKPAVENMPAHIRMYVLKDIDFIQPGKGVVVICPTSDGVTHERDYIKGYVYCGEHDSIKFETVQGWRYRKLGFDSIIGRRYNLEWSELMSAK